MVEAYVGELRHRVTIKSPATWTRTASGGETPGWGTTVATVWADIRPGRSREFFAAKQVNAEITHEIEIRHRSDITPLMRVEFGSRYFYIVSVINVGERKRRTVLVAREEV